MRPALARLLPLLIVLLAPPVTPVAAADEFETAMLAGEYERAAQIGVEHAEQRRTDAVAAYNAGCALSRAGRTGEAIEWLVESARRGFAGVRSIEHDADLAAVRELEDFKRVRAAVTANAEARFAEFRSAAEEAQPVVVRPRGHDPKTPTPLVIALHGTGGTGKGMADAWRDAAAATGAILVAPDALRRQPGSNGFSWVYRDEAEWMVMRMIDEARKAWAVGPVILAGYSQGANIALMLGQSHPDRFAAVIPVNGHYENDVADVPTDGDRPRWFLLIGERDPGAKTYDDAERDFRGAGMEVEKRLMPGRGHAFPTGTRAGRVLIEALEWALRPAQEENDD